MTPNSLESQITTEQLQWTLNAYLRLKYPNLVGAVVHVDRHHQIQLFDPSQLTHTNASD